MLCFKSTFLNDGHLAAKKQKSMILKRSKDPLISQWIGLFRERSFFSQRSGLFRQASPRHKQQIGCYRRLQNVRCKLYSTPTHQALLTICFLPSGVTLRSIFRRIPITMASDSSERTSVIRTISGSSNSNNTLTAFDLKVERTNLVARIGECGAVFRVVDGHSAVLRQTHGVERAIAINL